MKPGDIIPLLDQLCLLQVYALFFSFNFFGKDIKTKQNTECSHVKKGHVSILKVCFVTRFAGY